MGAVYREASTPAEPPSDPRAYTYDLPAERIASRPVRPRDSSRLLVLRRDAGSIEDRNVSDLPELLAPGDLLVVNETRVVRARLHGVVEETGRAVELLLVRESSPGRWLAWARPGRQMRPGRKIRFEGQGTIAHVLGREGETAELAMEGDVAALLAACGHVPLPPYIRREDDGDDLEDYQTVFAQTDGAVAAPTAGLHFTERLLARLAEHGIELARVLLHVGPGTFRPVRVDDLRDHRVEAEYFEISRPAARAIRDARRRGSRVLAVGTTSVRALESTELEEGCADRSRCGWTDLTIIPPFDFRVVTALMTNFHLPQSSLLLLVCAFAGREIVLAAYEEAVRRNYRFYSYGDAMLIL
jgi:S-adenosylmethionine:tRNA ribosyltransferase-isomerase